MEFSEKKFKNFSKEKQIKKVLDFCELIEKKWSAGEERKYLIKNLHKCVKWLPSEIKKDFTNLNKNFSDHQEFLKNAVPILHSHNRHLRDHDFLIYQQDGYRKKDKIPVFLILDNLRSAFNVGSIFRIAECFGIEEILICGYTSIPGNNKLEKTAMGTTKFMKWRYFDEAISAIKFLKEKQIPIYALETAAKARKIGNFVPENSFGLILGNEALGIPKEHLKAVDEIITIPLRGWKNSLNVGVSCAIALYELTKDFT